MFKVLSIDGGGIKGIFPAAFLESIEEATGKKTADHFDLIVGTSTGGIIALGLGLGFSASELKHFYIEHGPHIFPPIPSRLQQLAGKLISVFRVKYNPGPLRTALEATFGNRRLGEAHNRLVIPAMNATTGEVHVFKTSHHPRLQIDYKEKAVDVALATSAAPTYFPNHLMDGLRLLDGGIWANNPILVAAFEAIYVLSQQPQDVHILSLGCTGETTDISVAHGNRGGLWKWRKAGIEMVLKGQSESAVNMTRLMIGIEQVVRIQPIFRSGRFLLDDYTAASELEGLGKTEARKALPRISSTFLRDKVEPFTPSHILEEEPVHPSNLARVSGE